MLWLPCHSLAKFDFFNLLKYTWEVFCDYHLLLFSSFKYFVSVQDIWKQQVQCIRLLASVGLTTIFHLISGVSVECQQKDSSQEQLICGISYITSQEETTPFTAENKKLYIYIYIYCFSAIFHFPQNGRDWRENGAPGKAGLQSDFKWPLLCLPSRAGNSVT